MSITYEELAARLAVLCQEKSEWAGLPIPIPEARLRLEPRFPYAKLGELHTQPEGPMVDVVNSWFSERLRATVCVCKGEDGRPFAQVAPRSAAGMLLDTIIASKVWPFAAEVKAVEKLSTMIPPHMLEAYITTGMFLESSKRSGVYYIFRRLRPTIAFRADADGSRVLTTLCLHPIGYYDGTWAGVMVPTDDVIAHLCMMRGDEPKFWANANQHHPVNPASGL